MMIQQMLFSSSSESPLFSYTVLYVLLLLRVVQETALSRGFSIYFTIVAKDIVQCIIQDSLYKIVYEKCL